MKPKQKNRIYGNIFLSLTLTVVLTIFILSAILYTNFEQIALSLIYNSSSDNLSQVSYSVDFMTKTAKSLAQQIYHDPKIADLILFSPGLSEENAALEQLDNYRYTSTLYINSIYVYSKKADALYVSHPSSSSVEQDVKSFYDRQIVDILDSIGSYRRFEIIPRSVPLPPAAKGTARQTNNYTFLYYESVTGNTPDGAIVLNISEDWLHETMNSLNSNPVQSTFVIDGKGVLLTSDKTDGMLTDISKEAYIGKILASNAGKGYIVDDVRGVKSLVTYVTLESSGWKFIMVTPYGNVVGQIKKMQYYTVLAGFIILFAGLLASLLLARRIYKPIDKVLERLNSLNREKMESLNAMKQDYLRNLLHANTECDPGSVKTQFNALGIGLNPEAGFVLLIFRIDRFSDFSNKYNIADRRLFKYSIGSMASAICARYFANEAVDAGDDHIAVIMNAGADSAADLEKSLDAAAAEVLKAVSGELAITLSATIGSAAIPAAEIPGAYGEAMECSNCRLFMGRGCIIHAGNMQKNRAVEYAYPIGKEELLVNKLMLGKTKEMGELYVEIIHGAMEHSYAAFNIALLRLISTVSAAIIKLGKSNDVALNFSSEAFLKGLSRLETIGEVDEEFLRLFHAVTSGLDDKRKSKHDELLHAINAIIGDEYADPNLCLNSIAGKMDMSPVYLGRLFKSLTNESIGDHINSYRMEVVKSLLEKTNLSVGEIADRVGMLNKPHIYTLFKQEYGLTPNEYRKACGKQELSDG